MSKPGDPDYFCQWCYDKGLRYPDDGKPWRHGRGCPNSKRDTPKMMSEWRLTSGAGSALLYFGDVHAGKLSPQFKEHVCTALNQHDVLKKAFDDATALNASYREQEAALNELRKTVASNLGAQPSHLSDKRLFEELALAVRYYSPDVP